MSWWIDNPKRARQEKDALAHLEQDSEWLTFGEWGLADGLGLVLKFNIAIADKTYPLKLILPSYFPDVPAQVFHQNEERISSHQYGSTGELCLEYRPDNWLPEYNAALMIQSAYNLLNGENPESGEVALVVPNAHFDTMAQKLRGNKFRFLVEAEVNEMFENLDVGILTPVKIAEHSYAQHWIARIHSAKLSDDDNFANPVRVPRAKISSGCLLKFDSIRDLKVDDISALLSEKLADEEECRKEFDEGKGEFFFCCLDEKEALLFSIPRGSEDLKPYCYKTAKLPLGKNRLSEDYRSLSGKNIGIVGCGSLGSKLAVSFARAGVDHFVLVDGDVLLQENLVRNELNLESVGIHKADAVKQAILNVNTNAQCLVRRTLIGGQESAESLQVTFSTLEKCDLVIDATAEPEVFNYLVRVAKRRQIPVFWGEIFGGGFGGLVARSRPNREPSPERVRDAIADWCAQYPNPDEKSGLGKYEGSSLDGEPLIASDSEVQIIAGYLSKLVIDALLKPDESDFPASAYFIGFRKHWIFKAPFDVYPLHFEPDESWKLPDNVENKEELLKFMGEIFPKTDDSNED